MRRETEKKVDNQQLIALLEFWCRFFPKKCSDGSCKYRFQCKNKHKQCEGRKPNQTPDTYQEIYDDTKISLTTIKSYHKKIYGLHPKPVSYTTRFETFVNYLIDFRKKPPYNKDLILQKYLDLLQELYDVFDLAKGCEESAKAFDVYTYHPRIVKYWALFKNRNKDWDIVREVLKPMAQDINNDDEIREVCYLAIFESHLNEWTQRRHDEGIQYLINVRNNYLIRVPNKEAVGQYHYFYARYLEEIWWKSSSDTKRSGNHLTDALNSIRKSLDLYDGTAADGKIPWWLRCHEVILLKLLEPHPDFKSRLEEYNKMIVEAALSLPKKKSIQMYAVTNFLLHDDEHKLLEFFDKLNAQTETLYGSSNNIKEEESEVDNFSYHHAELIFFDQPDKLDRYLKLLQDWFKRKQYKNHRQ